MEKEMVNGYIEKGCSAAKLTIGNAILDIASSIAVRAENLVDSLDSKLSPISKDAEPFNQLKEEYEIYPRYFSSVRDSLIRIESALRAIESIKDRVEL